MTAREIPPVPKIIYDSVDARHAKATKRQGRRYKITSRVISDRYTNSLTLAYVYTVPERIRGYWVRIVDQQVTQ